MQVHPRKSREAHSQTAGQLFAAASPKAQRQDSLAPLHCELRGPQPVASRGVATGQPISSFSSPKQDLFELLRAAGAPASQPSAIMSSFQFAICAIVAALIGFWLAAGQS